MLPMASMNAVRYSGRFIKSNYFMKKKDKKYSTTHNFFPEKSSLCSENLILPLGLGSTSSVTTAWHEEKPSPEHIAESPQLMMKPCAKPALKIIKAQACILWNFGLDLKRGSVTHWSSLIPLKPGGSLWPWAVPGWQKRG